LVSQDEVLEYKVLAGTTAINQDAKQHREEAQHRRGSISGQGASAWWTILIDFCRPSALYKLRTYLKPSVLVIDEVGYLPLDQSSANWIFQVVSRRYEKSAPIVLTSNRGFSDWGQVFADQVVATAIVDRLIDNAIVINIRGRSYCMRAHQDSTNAKNGR